MAEGLVLEFDGFGRAEYEAVNSRLGIDMKTGQGDWPAGMLYHAGGAKPGGWVVFDVWDSRASQEGLVSERLGSAPQEGGVPRTPCGMECLDIDYAPATPEG